MPIRTSILLIVLLLLASTAFAQNKKLIEFGWDEPDTAFMRTHIAEMEKSPFDGCVFHVDYKTPQGQRGRLTWEGWGGRAVAWEDLQGPLADMKATPFKSFKHNYLRFNTTPARLDWFDDYSAVLNNARMAARFARESGCPGLLFDIEQYEGKLFTFPAQRDAKTKGYPAYAAQVRQRGREVMEAFQQEYPDLTVFMSFGYSIAWLTTMHKPEGLQAADYGLMGPFMDGLVDGAKGKTRIIDGHELSYAFKTKAEFEKAYRDTTVGLLPIVANKEKYRQVATMAFGVWMDDDWRHKGWDVNDVSRNYFTPEAFEKSVRAALEVSDEYVWIYTEEPRWWGPNGRQKLPEAYDQSLRRALGRQVPGKE